jgi:serine/threonine protein kinase
MAEFAPSRHPGLPQLTAYAHGKAVAGERAAIQSHLRDCPACRKALAALPGDPDSHSEQDTAPPPSKVPHAAAPRPPVGAVLPDLAGHARYEVLELLGRGGMGAVYKARHKVMNRLVALKVVNAQFLDSTIAIERFHREVQAAARLAHPNIVTAFDADQVGDTHFLVMEFVAGTDLAQYVEKKGPLPVTYACHFIRQAALGLQHAHELGMVHRDIKPHNLLLTPQGVVKVADFGLARLAREAASAGGLTAENVLVGTADYIAPEQAQDAHGADIRADIYSLGCTLFHLLAGRPPFGGANAIQKVAAHLMDEVPLGELPSTLPDGLRAVVTRMVEKAPAKRYTTPAEVAQALAPFVKKTSGVKGSSPAPPVPPAVVQPSPTPTQREASSEPTPSSPHIDTGPSSGWSSLDEPIGDELVSLVRRRQKRRGRRWYVAALFVTMLLTVLGLAAAIICLLILEHRGLGLASAAAAVGAALLFVFIVLVANSRSEPPPTDEPEA